MATSSVSASCGLLLASLMPLACSLDYGAFVVDESSQGASGSGASATGASSSTGGSGAAAGAGGATGGAGGTASSGGSGGSGASTGGGGGAPPSPCAPGRTADDQDDFNGGLAAFWTPYGPDVAGVNDRLEIAYQGGAVYAGVNAPVRSMRGCFIQVRVVDTLVQEASAFTVLDYRLDAGNRTSISITNGQLRFIVRTSGQADTENIAYNGAVHRYLRLVEDTGLVRFQTSTDGNTWTTHREATTPSYIDDGFARLFAGSGAPNTPATAVFDDFNQF